MWDCLFPEIASVEWSLWSKSHSTFPYLLRELAGVDEAEGRSFLLNETSLEGDVGP